MGVISIFTKKYKIYKKDIIILLSILLVFTFVIYGSAKVEYIKVIKSEAYILVNSDDPFTVIGIAKEGNIFKCIEFGNYFCKIILFSGEARYINSANITKIDYHVELPENIICKEINTLINDVKKNIDLEIKEKYLNDSVKLKKSQKEYYNLLIDRYLLKLFELCDINPADYSQILIQTRK